MFFLPVEKHRLVESVQRSRMLIEHSVMHRMKVAKTADPRLPGLGVYRAARRIQEDRFRMHCHCEREVRHSYTTPGLHSCRVGRYRSHRTSWCRPIFVQPAFPTVVKKSGNTPPVPDHPGCPTGMVPSHKIRSLDPVWISRKRRFLSNEGFQNLRAP